MTTANDDFEDLMPHRIEVVGESAVKPTYDEWGQPVEIGEAPSKRTYRCLIDDTTTTIRTAEGENINVSLTAYVAPVPMESNDGQPVNIESDEEIWLTDPFTKKMTVKNIERHYDSEDGVGMLHNIVLRFG